MQKSSAPTQSSIVPAILSGIAANMSRRAGSSICPFTFRRTVSRSGVSNVFSHLAIGLLHAPSPLESHAMWRLVEVIGETKLFFRDSAGCFWLEHGSLSGNRLPGPFEGLA